MDLKGRKKFLLAKLSVIENNACNIVNKQILLFRFALKNFISPVIHAKFNKM